MPKPNGLEYRQAHNLRMSPEGDEITVEGHAAVFDQDANIGGWFIERIAPGAFKDAIGRDDVVFLINHQGLPLARTRSGTLHLEEDDTGLFMRSELDVSDPDVALITPKMKRGDLDKMSFAFYPEVEEWDETGEIPVRTIVQAGLADVSIVTNPAYDGTDIGLRSASKAALERHRKDQKASNFDAARRRLRLRMDHGLRSRGDN